MGITTYTKQEMLRFLATVEHEVLTYLQQEHIEDATQYNYSNYGFKFTPTGETIYTHIIQLENTINTATNNTILVVDNENYDQWAGNGYKNTVPWRFDIIGNKK